MSKNRKRYGVDVVELEARTRQNYINKFYNV